MRKSGILMHISSLNGPYGIGTLGKEAREFVDFLQAAGQKCWQILPLNPTGFGNSPYQSFSTFAGNPYFIDPPTLVEEGLLRESEVERFDGQRVDYGWLYNTRFGMLRKAFSRFRGDENYTAFCEKNSFWLKDYALFMALKDHFGGACWLDWPKALRVRGQSALEEYSEKLKEEVAFYRFMQYKFAVQWQSLKAYAKEKGISIIGDVPIYVSMDSADVWSNPQLFLLDEAQRPTRVAGCPPDFFSEDGQLWGNPLYDWEKMQKDGYKWWCTRLSAAGNWYDTVRIDHFRAFESFWAVPAGDATARNGQWLPGPGLDFIHTVQLRLPQLSFIAEDLGFLTEEVHRLRDDSGWPGMKILEFAFDSEDSEYLPHNYPKNAICYLGTHDNAPAAQYLHEVSQETREHIVKYFSLTEAEGYVWGMLRGAMASVADTFIAQAQDYLGLGAESRMNSPGVAGDSNWSWRAEPNAFTPELAEKIRCLTCLYGR